jgi:hypothetical protein
VTGAPATIESLKTLLELGDPNLRERPPWTPHRPERRALRRLTTISLLRAAAAASIGRIRPQKSSSNIAAAVFANALRRLPSGSARSSKRISVQLMMVV